MPESIRATSSTELKHCSPLLKTKAVLAALMLAFVLLHAASCRRAAPGGRGQPQGAVPVRTEAVVKGSLSVFLDGLGTVTPLNTVLVRSRVDGQLMKVLFEEGQNVKANDLLVIIDPRPFSAQVSQLEGQLSRDAAQLENARRDLERYENLIRDEAVPRQQLDSQRSLVRQLEGVIRLDQGLLENARLQLSYCEIRSPIGGRVGLRLVDPGNIIHVNDSNGLAVVTQLEPISVIFTIAEDFLPQVLSQSDSGKELPVDVFDRAQNKKLSSGKLITVDNQIDVTTGTVRLRALFPNNDRTLFPNQFVNARLLVRTEENATLIPNQAIQQGPQGSFVYAINGEGKASVKYIKVNISDEKVSSVDGVSPGELIAIDGLDKLREGVITAGAGANSSQPAL